MKQPCKKNDNGTTTNHAYHCTDIACLQSEVWILNDVEYGILHQLMSIYSHKYAFQYHILWIVKGKYIEYAQKNTK